MWGSANSWWGLTSLVPLSFQAKSERQRSRDWLVDYQTLSDRAIRVGRNPWSWSVSFCFSSKAESRSCQLHFNMPTHASNRVANLFKRGKQMSVILDKKKNTKSHGHSGYFAEYSLFFRQRSFYLWNPAGTLPVSLPLGDLHRAVTLAGLFLHPDIVVVPSTLMCFPFPAYQPHTGQTGFKELLWAVRTLDTAVCAVLGPCVGVFWMRGGFEWPVNLLPMGT